MKYMLIMNTPRDGYTQYTNWPKKIHRLDAVCAHLLERAGECVAAVELYRGAASKTASVPERNYLMMKAARLMKTMR